MLAGFGSQTAALYGAFVPSGFHAAAERPLKLAGRYAFLGRTKQVDGLKPQMQLQVAFLKDGAEADCELLTAIAALVEPVTLDAGGLWILYTTGLYPAMMHEPAVHLVVQVHVLTAGSLLAYAVAGVDPIAHRPRHPVRAVALLVFLAAHAVLAKYLYGHPPAGVPGPEGRNGAELMYYGGDLADLALVTIFCWQWYDPARFRVGGRRPPQPWRLPAEVPFPAAPGTDLS